MSVCNILFKNSCLKLGQVLSRTTNEILLPRRTLVLLVTNRSNTCISSSYYSSTINGRNRRKYPRLADGNSVLPIVAFGESSQYIQSRSAGHSKWANIKHTKAQKDGEKAREIDRYIRAIRTAARENNSCDPKVNKKLNTAIERAKEAKVPSSSIQKALDHLTKGFKNAGDLRTFVFPLKGPGGCVFVAILETGHLMRARQDLSTPLKKHSFSVTEDSVLYQFVKKGIILCTGINGTPLEEKHLEECVEDAIEAEANDVKWIDSPIYGNVMEFTTEPVEFFKVCKNLENLNYEIVYSEVDYLPLNPVELDDAQLENASTLYNKLLELQDVVKVYDNIA